MESEVPVKLPYGYVLAGKEITAHEEKTDAVRGIFKYYLAGASLGKIVNMLFAKGLSFSTVIPNRPRPLWKSFPLTRNLLQLLA